MTITGTTMNQAVTIRPLSGYDEYLSCEMIQRLAWNMTDARDVVPAHMLKPMAEHGGMAIGAFNQKAEIVGFLVGFIGKTDDERSQWMGMPYIFCSEMMGVLPEYRGQSVGYQLKLAQRDYALEQGYRLIIWTYDPLLSLNANLNIRKLGCICRQYVEDAYGQMSGMYAGLSTDRFSVEWWIASQHVSSRVGTPDEMQTVNDWLASGAEVVNTASPGSAGPLRPGDYHLAQDAQRLIVEFPTDIQAVKQADMGLAQAWREHTRALFEEAFGKGYVVTGFGRGAPKREQSSFYLLSSQLDIPSMARGADEGRTD
jgi:predicted GNAT superfamily acetyltransferase